MADLDIAALERAQKILAIEAEEAAKEIRTQYGHGLADSQNRDERADALAALATAVLELARRP